MRSNRRRHPEPDGAGGREVQTWSLLPDGSRARNVALVPALMPPVVNNWCGGVGAILVADLAAGRAAGRLARIAPDIWRAGLATHAGAIAAENSDTFDALSRAYNYLY